MRVVEIRVERSTFGETLAEMREWIAYDLPELKELLLLAFTFAFAKLPLA